MGDSGFSAVIGHGDVIRHLTRAIRKDRVSHAYLITGDKGSGRHMIAEAFARALVCDRLRSLIGEGGADSLRDEEIDACGQCPSCKKASSGNHPDILHVTHGTQVLRVEEIREQVTDTAEIRPYEGGKKIYIIPDAEAMNAAAQNALLKTMEEPRPYVVMILIATSQEAVLPTVLSRCVRLPLLPVPDRLVRRYLEETMMLPDYEARKITALAQGNPGRAIEAVSDSAAGERRMMVLKLLGRRGRMNAAEISDAAAGMKEDREHIFEILDLMLMYYRDIMVMKATGRDDMLIFRDEAQNIRTEAGGCSYGELRRIFGALDQARVRIGANVNFDLTMESLLSVLRADHV